VALVASEIAREAYALGDKAEAARHALEAARIYRETALTPWARRPMAIALFAVEEYNVLKAWVEARRWDEPLEIDYLSDKLIGVPDCDLRITLAWDADETDVDIHVTEPSGEEAYYAHRLTTMGGRVSEDITDGFGPELYETRRAQDGIYNIRAHYYVSHQQAIFGPATCTLTVYTDWGRPTQAQQVTTTRLDNQKQMIPVGTAAYEAAARQDGEGEPEEKPEVDARQVMRGMSAEEVIALLGEPDRRDTWSGGEQWIFKLPSNRQLAVFLAEEVVERVVERMPWGESMIISQ
jgi:outer membrane protein assembly factor BamE (lipoprotein component of BamABCDE complex)